MGRAFNDDDYPLASIILNTQFLSHNDELKNDIRLQDMIHNECIHFLMGKLFNQNEIQYFDYKLKFDKFGDRIDIVPKNMLTALWFINIFPKHGKDVINKKEYTSLFGTYKFDGRSKTLKKI